MLKAAPVIVIRCGCTSGGRSVCRKSRRRSTTKNGIGYLKVNSNKHSQFFVFNNTLSSLRTKKIMVLI